MQFHGTLKDPDLIKQAKQFLEHALKGLAPDHELVEQLCTRAASADQAVAKPAVRTLYGIIVEGLCDDFSSTGVEVCNQVLLRIIDFVRSTPQGMAMDAKLTAMGCATTEQLLHRHEACRIRPALDRQETAHVKKCFILSRVSAGADVAITSVILQRLAASLPQAELIFIGPRHTAAMFHAIPNLRCLTLPYRRHGTLFDRILFWPDLHEIILRESQGLKPEEILLFDPDTRLTELGLLPLIDANTTCYFNSRRPPADGGSPPLAELTNSWLNFLLSEEKSCTPACTFAPYHLQAVRSFIERLPDKPFRIVINLGVSGNDRKRICNPFEGDLLPALLQTKETLIFLDSGHSDHARSLTENLLSHAHERGITTAFVREAELPEKTIPFSHGIVGFHGSIGAIGALIHEADCFIGYDSLCQHMATAIGTPAVVAFAGAPNKRFIDRWRPQGSKNNTTTIEVPNSSKLSSREVATIIKRITDEVAVIRKQADM